MGGGVFCGGGVGGAFGASGAGAGAAFLAAGALRVGDAGGERPTMERVAGMLGIATRLRAVWAAGLTAGVVVGDAAPLRPLVGDAPAGLLEPAGRRADDGDVGDGDTGRFAVPPVLRAVPMPDTPVAPPGDFGLAGDAGERRAAGLGEGDARFGGILSGSRAACE